MAVESNIEWKLESALIYALGQSSDFTSGTAIRRAFDYSSDVSYPCVTVQCFSSEHPDEYAGRTGFEISFIEIASYTERDADTTGSVVTTNLGAARDVARNVNFVQWLNTITAITVYGAKESGPSVHSDTFGGKRIRRRAFTVQTWATCTDVPDESSSSSSSSSSGGSSLSSSSSSQSSSSSTQSASSISSTSESSANSSSSSASSSQSSTSEST
jgi:hypothetical protein